MENSNTTCFISLEKPLTVTFTVDDVERCYDWANHVSGKHQNDGKCDICSVLKDFGNLCGVPRSLSDSDIFAKFLQDNDFSACNENSEPENRKDFSTNQVSYTKTIILIMGLMRCPNFHIFIPLK